MSNQMDRNRDAELPIKSARTSSLNALFEGNAAFEVGKARARSYIRIGMEIRALREKAGLTQHELAKRLKKPQSFVAKYEGGERRVDVVEFITICRSLSADPARLIKKLDESA